MNRDGRTYSAPTAAAAAGRFFTSRIIVLVSLSAVMVVALGLFASRSLATLNHGTEWVVHAQRVRYQLSHLLQLLVDMGGGLRRYEMTGDEQSFETAEAAVSALPDALASLHDILADEPRLRASEAELLAAVRARVRLTRDMVAMARAGNVAGIHAIIERGENVAVLDACRAVIARMQDEEERIFDMHRRSSAGARDSVAFAIVAMTTLAVILLVLVAYVSMRHSARLQRVSQEADRRKDVFLATLSHELRNPLAPIRNAARLLEFPNLTADQLERSRLIITRQVRHMASLLDDLLDVSRITRGMLTLKKEHVDLAGPFEAAIETARPAIDAKGHALDVEWPAQRVRLTVDPVRLIQIVTNLLTNAAKYTESPGRITLGSRMEGSDAVIYVRDNGIGLAADDLTQVFEMFSQVAPARGHSDGGLGIGLALVKGLVELHGGRIEARSAGLGHGSEFIVYFPEPNTESAAAAPVPAA